MGYSLSSNSHFQMGVTIIGFAEHFGHYYVVASVGMCNCVGSKLVSFVMHTYSRGKKNTHSYQIGTIFKIDLL